MTQHIHSRFNPKLTVFPQEHFDYWISGFCFARAIPSSLLTTMNYTAFDNFRDAVFHGLFPMKFSHWTMKFSVLISPLSPYAEHLHHYTGAGGGAHFCAVKPFTQLKGSGGCVFKFPVFVSLPISEWKLQPMSKVGFENN